jgi:putative ABC transport system permease protein
MRESVKEYTLCGIAEGNVSFFDNRDGIIANLDGDVDYVTFSYKTLDNTFYEKADALKKETGAATITYNTDLLDYSGVSRGSSTIKTVKAFTAIILGIIVFASVFMIYDSFAVSYQERERYLGMLASVGATKRQKRTSIYFEGLILGCIAIPAGIAAGFIGMAITFRSIQGAFLSTFAIPIQGTLKCISARISLSARCLRRRLRFSFPAIFPHAVPPKQRRLRQLRAATPLRLKGKEAARFKADKKALRLRGRACG